MLPGAGSGVAQFVEGLLRKLVEDLSSDTHPPNKNLGDMVSIIPVLRREGWADLWNLPASLAESGVSGFRERLCLRKQGEPQVMKTPIINFRPPHAYAYVCAHTHKK